MEIPEKDIIATPGRPAPIRMVLSNVPVMNPLTEMPI